MAAGDPQPLFRAQDVGTSTALRVTPRPNLNVHANKVNFGTDSNTNKAKPRYNQADYIGGVPGDEPNSTANVAVARQDGAANEPDYSPRKQSQRAAAMGTVNVVDVGRNPGWIGPKDPYGAPPASPANDPTTSALTPSTAVAGAGTPQFVVKITGTNFTPYSEVLLAGNKAPLFTYVSPTEMRVQMSPASSVAGTTSVQVRDHGVISASRNFTWT